MDNQLFLPFTFAEIYNKTPKELRGQDVCQFNGLYIGTIKYGGKNTDIACIYYHEINRVIAVLCDDTGIIL